MHGFVRVDDKSVIIESIFISRMQTFFTVFEIHRIEAFKFLKYK